MSNGENRGRCKVCKPICERKTTNSKAARRVSKELALAVWEHGQPEENWAIYDQPICDQCRKYLTNKFLSDEIRSKCDHVFDNERNFCTKINLCFSNLDCLYNKSIVFTPVSSESGDDSDNYPYHIDDQYYSDATDNLNKFKRFLDEIGFTGRCESTYSYASLKNSSKRNFCLQAKKIIFYLPTYLASNDVQTLWDDIVQHDFRYHSNEK